ncbi:uncharacterized membrane protein (DUF441 family) [Sinomonas atrocyanea]|uniref:hypothetical protein n=1 Tax=Sinomonas atrocyanea TaxID=37927 RepID=UPI00278964EE|nr:hypothetical protein [Sinomonas atrocyanea]MDP9884811.1 uncharacterized membrane protein (DUF441 family) [Sinomonas atrocyanea]
MAGAVRLADAADRGVGRVRADGPRAAMALLPQALACGDVTAVVLARGVPAAPTAAAGRGRRAQPAAGRSR